MLQHGKISTIETDQEKRISFWAERLDSNYEPDALLNTKEVIQLNDVAPDGEKVRWDLVLRTQAEIKSGTYETPERLAAAAKGLAKLLLPELE